MNQLIKNSLSFSLASLLSIAVSASYAGSKEEEEYRNPLGCRDVGYEFELKVLNVLPEEAGERNSLYFVFNKADKPINLYQMRQDESTRSLFLNHEIQPKKWAVLSTSEQEIKYICTMNNAKSKSKYGKVVDCGENLQVCEFARVRFGLNNRGNHWIVKSNNRNGAVREVVWYGIIPQ